MTNLLVLGGTQWLGREVARAALGRGHSVTCLARGESGAVADGARLVSADRDSPDAYDEVRRGDWDHVVDVSWQPGHVRTALAALGPRAARWSYVSSCSVYADDGTPGADESAALVEPIEDGTATGEEYAGAKVACEAAVAAAVGDRALIARAGLIGGPGDRSDRFGYWVARLALAGTAPVLVPDTPELATQTIDVRDLAAWLVDASAVGAYNAVGPQIALGPLLDQAALVAGFTGEMVTVPPQWLVDHEVEPWAGPRSLPLWLPVETHAGSGARDDAAAVAAGLHRRTVAEMLRDTLAYERSLGLDRDRRAGMSRAEELALLAAR